MTAITLSAQDLITVQGNQPRTTSLKVAEAFGKRHTHVIDKIKSLDCSANFASANFSAYDQDVPIGNGAQRKSKVYEMTKDGFMFLVMGFTGKKAAQVKESYINAFNEMAEKLYGKITSKPARKQKALPGGLTLEQQDAIKGLVRARVDAVPAEKRAKAAITCWSSLKSKFGCTYKEIDPCHFTEAASLVARVSLDGEYIPKDEPKDSGTVDGVNRAMLYALIVHMERLRGHWLKLDPALRAMGSPFAPRMHDHIQGGAAVARALANTHADQINSERLAQSR